MSEALFIMDVLLVVIFIILLVDAVIFIDIRDNLSDIRALIIRKQQKKKNKGEYYYKKTEVTDD